MGTAPRNLRGTITNVIKVMERGMTPMLCAGLNVGNEEYKETGQ